MPAITLEDYKVIDSDTHISEPEDLWTSRVSVQKWGDMVPHVVPCEDLPAQEPEGGGGMMRYREGERVWLFGGEPAWGVASVAITGHKEHFPSHPPTLAEAHPGAWQAVPRLEYMDEEGIYAQVLYPNVGGFGSGRFVSLKDPGLMLACVQAYNDFLVDWSAPDSDRLIGMAAMPFWDRDLCVQEIARCAKKGLRGLVWGGHTETYDLPRLADPHWDRVWSAAEDVGFPINFHIDGASARLTYWEGYDKTPATRLTRHIPTTMLDNMGHITDMILSGICHRHPRLKVVAVESGVGWIPFLLEMMDWNWREQRGYLEHPDWELTPGEFFQRQCYGCFWAENEAARSAIRLYPDNCLFETDFPHPVSLTKRGMDDPDTGGSAREHIQDHFSDLPEATLRKVLHDNAARIYHVV